MLALKVRPQRAIIAALEFAADGVADLVDHPSSLLIVDGDDTVEETELVTVILGDADERERVFREARAAPAWPGLEELLADALVVADAEDHRVDVGADGLADGGDGVDEADLGGQERVARVLDGFGRGRVGDDHRCSDADVEAGDPDGGAPDRRTR